MADNSDDGGARAGRVRKKSAKVLEMEEFEEAEKKQFTKKAGTDSGKAAKAAASPSPTAPPPAKKIKMKVERAEDSPPVKTERPDMSPVASLVKQEQVTPPPTRVTPQAVKQPASSVIKFLLSSPAVPTTPSVSTKAVTKSSPPIPEGETQIKGTQISAALKKSLKSKVMMDSEDDQTSDVAVPKQEELDVKPTLFASPPPQLMNTTPILSHSTLSSKPIDAAGSMDSLKMKLILSPKEKKPKATFEQMLESGNEATALALAKSAKKKKKKPVITVTPAKEPVSATPKPVSIPEPQSASQAMPNLAALVTSGKKKVPSKKKSKPVMPTTPIKTEELSPEETSAKLSTSPVDVEFEPNLVIAEEGDKVKPKKKLTGSGSKTKKKHSEDGTKAAAPEGDIAALAAKVKVKGGKKKDDSEVLSKKRKRPPTAYTLYCNAHRAKLVAENPGIDFAQISRRLGEMWQTLTKKEKWCWRRKAKKMAGKGSTLISTGKTNKTKPPAPAPTTPPAPPAVIGLPVAKPMVPHQGARIAKANVEESALSPIKGFGSEPVDVAAHLKLLGESLSNIGMRLQEHKGLIAVQGSMSVLLDSLMCSFGPLMCLTQQVPEINGCSRETHAKTLDNIAYVMPGL